jgi:hypothetical protein
VRTQTGPARTALTWGFFEADDGIRTRDPHLGKVIQARTDASLCTKALLRSDSGISPYQDVLFLLRHVCGTRV